MKHTTTHTSRTSVILVIFFALASLGSGIVAWRQYKELIGLRTGNVSLAELEAQKKKVFDLENTITRLNAEIASLRAAGANDSQVARGNNQARAGANVAQAGGRGGQQQGGQNQGQQDAQIQALMQSPQYQRAVVAQQRAAIDLQYAGLFNSLGLPADQLEQVKGLMVDQASVIQDIQAAAAAQGVRGGNLQELVAAAQADINNSLQTALGTEGYAALQNYQSTLNQRQQLSQIQASLTMAGVPLDQSQVDQVIQTLTQTSARTGRGGGGAAVAAFGGGFGGRGGGGTQVNISGNDVAALQSLLTPAQLQAVSLIQQQQQATNQLNQLTAQARGGGGAAATTVPAATVGNRGAAGTRAAPTTGGAAAGGRGGRGGG